MATSVIVLVIHVYGDNWRGRLLCLNPDQFIAPGCSGLDHDGGLAAVEVVSYQLNELVVGLAVHWW